MVSQRTKRGAPADAGLPGERRHPGADREHAAATGARLRRDLVSSNTPLLAKRGEGCVTPVTSASSRVCAQPPEQRGLVLHVPVLPFDRADERDLISVTSHVREFERVRGLEFVSLVKRRQNADERRPMRGVREREPTPANCTSA